MRKRRRLADKLTIVLCAVVVAVSAFFYAPMEVSAEESENFDLSGYSQEYVSEMLSSEEIYDLVGSFEHDSTSYYFTFATLDLDSIDLSDSFSLDASKMYSVDINFNFSMQCSDYTFSYPNTFSVTAGGTEYLLSHGTEYKYASLPFSVSDSVNIIFSGSDSVLDFDFISAMYSRFTQYLICNFDCDVSFSNLQPLSSSSSDEYQNGYNAGYAAGEQAGYGSGYSDGYADGENSVDTDAIYDEAFQAGKDSVNTDSYYDAGYDAGYQVGVQESYEIGYEDGYQSAMDRIDGWGADPTDYPVLVFDKSLVNVKCLMEVETNMPSVGYGQADLCNLDIDINPSHTYKIVFDSGYRSTSVNNFSGSQNEQFNYNIGLYSFPYSYGESFCFVQGSSLSSVFRLEIFDYSSHFYEIGGNNDVYQPWSASRLYNFESIDIYVYDYGPSGETQNHIANQTDSLTNGFNDSQGNSVNNEFSSGLNDFETAEDSLFATATSGMKDFTFFDIGSVPAMVTGMSFVGSIMSGWFTQAGGASGVGIVLSILFSIMLVAMVLGLYRWYQSKGGKD